MSEICLLFAQNLKKVILGKMMGSAKATSPRFKFVFQTTDTLLITPKIIVAATPPDIKRDNFNWYRLIHHVENLFPD
jgi:hypothetical protein